MKNPSKQEVAELVEFGRDDEGCLFVMTVKGSVFGDVMGDVVGDVHGHVWGTVWGRVCGTVKGTISGRRWQYAETIKEQIIRLIREGKTEEAINMLEEIH